MEILILLFLLQIKHCYADFMIQTYAQTVKKGIYRDWVGITHSLDHAWTSIVALTLFSAIFPISFWSIILVPIVEGIVHYHIDWTKVHFGCKDNTKPLFWAQFGYDQLAHQATYLLMVWFLLVN